MSNTTIIAFFIALMGSMVTSCKKTGSSSPVISQAVIESQLLAKLRVNKDNISSGKFKAHTASHKTTSSLDYSNENNPFEWVGTSHNSSLDYMAGYISDLTDNQNTLTITIREPLSQTTNTVTCTGLMEKVRGLSQKYWNENVSDVYVAPYVNANALSNTTESNASSTVTNYLVNNPIVDPRVSGLNSFNEDIYTKLQYFVSNYDFTNFEAHADSIIIYQIMETDSFELSLAIILQAEDDFIASTISPTIRTRQLAFLSILRNSLGYWYDVANTPNHPWHQLNGSFESIVGTHEGYARFSWHNFWGTVLECVADAIGGAAGEAIGAAGGPIVAGICGGIVGAACSGGVAGIWP